MRRWLLCTLLLAPVMSRGEDAGQGVDAAPQRAPSVAIPEPVIPATEPPELLREGSDADLGWSLVRMVLVLGIVVAIAYLTLNVGLRKLLGLPAGGRKGIVSVVERLPLDQKRTLYVVRAGDDLLLLGGTDLGVTFLSKLDPKLADALPQPAATGQVISSPFLQKLLGKKEAPPPPPAT
jgi:flagellar protein FliO/FliZ